MADARQLVAASVANERREVAGLALRRAEAKMRRSADLSLHARFSHQPLANPKALLTEEAGRTSGVETAAPCPTAGDQTPATGGNCVHDRAGSRSVHPIFEGGAAGHPTKTCSKDRDGDYVVSMAVAGDAELDGTAGTIPVVDSSRSVSSSVMNCGDDDSIGDILGSGEGEEGTCLNSGRREEGGLKAVGYDRKRQWNRQRQEHQQRQKQDQQQRPVHRDGLQELKREISELEGKILGRLSGVDGGGGIVGDDRCVHGDEDGDQATGTHSVGNCVKGGDSGDATLAKRSARTKAASVDGR